MDNEKLLARMAQMEAELSTLRQSKQPEKQFDVSEYNRQLAQQITNDPFGTLGKMGVPTDHIMRVAVTHALGDKATPEQRMFAQMGPQISAQQALASNYEALSRRLEDMDAKAAQASRATSMQKLIADKAKYPHISKAYEADPSLFESDLAGHKGSAEELATALEARASKMAKAFGVASQPASEDAETTAQSSQGKPATGDTITDVPSLPVNKVGEFTSDDHQKLKAEILRKYPPPTPQ